MKKIFNPIAIIAIIAITLTQTKAEKMEKFAHDQASKRGVTGQDYLRMQTYYSDLFKGLVKDYGNCKIIGVTYNEVDSLTAGILYLDNEFYSYNGKTPYNGTDAVYVTKEVTELIKPYQDGISRKYIEVYTAKPANAGDTGAIRIDNLQNWEIIRLSNKRLMLNAVANQTTGTNTFVVADVIEFQLTEGMIMDIEMRMEAQLHDRTQPYRGLNMSRSTPDASIFRLQVGANYYKIYRKNATDLVDTDNAIVDGGYHPTEGGFHPLVRFRFVASLDSGNGGFVLEYILAEDSGEVPMSASGLNDGFIFARRKNGFITLYFDGIEPVQEVTQIVSGFPIGYKPEERERNCTVVSYNPDASGFLSIYTTGAISTRVHSNTGAYYGTITYPVEPR